MSTIRPGLPPTIPNGPQPSSAASLAQQAFFRAALNGAQVTTAAATPAAPRPATATMAEPTRASTDVRQADTADPLPRLGALLDIRV